MNIKEIEEMSGKKFGIRVALRTGDTTTAERAKMAKKAPHIFITTPESLAIILTSKNFVEKLRETEFCIVDEIHALDNKRGAYLSLTLERLNEVASKFPCKIGLSATIAPLEEVAKYLVGIAKDREVSIAEVPLDKKVDIQILSPTKNILEEVGLHHKMYELI